MYKVWNFISSRNFSPRQEWDLLVHVDNADMRCTKDTNEKEQVEKKIRVAKNDKEHIASLWL